MVWYRLYFFDRTGHIVRREEFELETDAQALDKARELDHADLIEVWDRERKVGAVHPGYVRQLKTE